MQESQRFLTYLLAHAPHYPHSYLTLTAIHPDHQHPTPSRHLRLSDRRAIAQGLEDLLQANQQAWGAFVAVGWRRTDLGRWRRGGNADVVALPALYVDVDDAQALERLESFQPSPSCIVHSGHGLHAYWWLADPLTDMKLAGCLLRALSQQLKGDALSIAQSLRLPGSQNTKHIIRASCRLLKLEAQRYSSADFVRYLPLLGTQTLPRRQQTSAKHSPKHLNPTLVQAVLEVLKREYGGFERRNAWWGALCPCGHLHDRPGQHFAFQPELGLGVCQGRHGRLLLKDLCECLSITPAEYGGLYERTRYDTYTPSA